MEGPILRARSPCRVLLAAAARRWRRPPRRARGQYRWLLCCSLGCSLIRLLLLTSSGYIICNLSRFNVPSCLRFRFLREHRIQPRVAVDRPSHLQSGPGRGLSVLQRVELPRGSLRPRMGPKRRTCFSDENIQTITSANRISRHRSPVARPASPGARGASPSKAPSATSATRPWPWQTSTARGARRRWRTARTRSDTRTQDGAVVTPSTTWLACTVGVSWASCYSSDEPLKNHPSYFRARLATTPPLYYELQPRPQV